MLWNTFYGSTADDAKGFGIATDALNNVYVTGYSTRTWQGDGGRNPLHAYSTNGKKDIFVLKLDSSGAYQWHTFYGAVTSNPYWATGEVGKAIAVDGGNNVYVTGYSMAAWLGSGNAQPRHAYCLGDNLTILKLDANGLYQWHTFYGADTPGSIGSHDIGNGIAVNGDDVYVTGSSYKSWLGDGGANPLHPHTGGKQLSILKVDSTGDYRWHTFYGYGAGGDDEGFAIAVTGAKNIHVAGSSSKTWLGNGGKQPLHAGAFQQGYKDVAVLKISDPVVPVKVVSPNGGETLNSGATFPVKWQAPVHAIKFKVLYSLDNGITWKASHSTPYVTLSYNWTLPVTNSPKCLLKVVGYTWNSKVAGTDISDASFSINTVKLTSPNGGNVLVSKNVARITYRKNKTATAAKTVLFYYSVNGGTTWKLINSFTGAYDAPDSYYYDWTVPSISPASTTCKVKVVLKDGTGAIVGSDMSDALFTITP